MLLGIDIGGTSVKLAALRDGAVAWTASSASYARPSTEQIIAAIAGALSTQPPALSTDAVGICVPGLLDRGKRMVTLSVNVPGLVGVTLDELVQRPLGRHIDRLAMTSDAVATALGIWFERKLTGRLLCLALGTGIGAAVLDDGAPLRVSGDSPGHIGQLDVSIAGHEVIGPDGGAGSLEGYLGAPALRQRYGSDVLSAIASWKGDEIPLRALARAIRICHAIYRPQHVVLAGGLGIRLGHVLGQLRTMIETNLTRVAREGWTLSTGDSDFHAAVGAAVLAGM